MDSVAAIVLGAGKGTRMKSPLPKVLHKIMGKSMIQRVVNILNQIGISKMCVVLSKDTKLFESFIKENDIVVTIQEDQKGTADAVSAASFGFQNTITPDYSKGKLLSGQLIDSDHVIICYGDTPILSKKILQELLEFYQTKRESLVVLGMKQPNPFGYGRMIIGKNQNLLGIVEEKDASNEEKKIDICNSGIMVCNRELLFSLLAKVDNKNNQKEYYLTDIIKYAVADKLSPKVFIASDYFSFQGINDRLQLSHLEQHLNKDIISHHLKNGVSITLPDTVYIEDDVIIGENSIIEPGVVLKKSTIIGRNCVIKAGCYLEATTIEDNNILDPNTHLISKTN